MIQGIHISSSSVILRNLEKDPSGSLLLKTGQVLDAKVLDVLSPTRAELLINGTRILADTSLLLRPGEHLQLKVVSEDGHPVLKLFVPFDPSSSSSSLLSLLKSFSQESPFAGLTKHLAGLLASRVDPAGPGKDAIAPLKGLLSTQEIKQLGELLYSLSLKSDKPDPGFLPRLLGKSGLSFENSVMKLLLSPGDDTIKTQLETLIQGDLKGNVLKLISLAQTASPETASVFKDFTDNIEQFQILNRYASESGRYLIPFPIFSQGAFSFGQILVDSKGAREKNGDRQQGLLRVSLLLSMTHLGALRVDVSILKPELSAVFQVSDPQVLDFVTGQLPELKENLEKRGFKVFKIECRIAESQALSDMSLFETVIHDNDRILNVVI